MLTSLYPLRIRPGKEEGRTLPDFSSDSWLQIGGECLDQDDPVSTGIDACFQTSPHSASSCPVLPTKWAVCMCKMEHESSPIFFSQSGKAACKLLGN